MENEEIDFFEWWEMLDDIEREEYSRYMKELEESELQKENILVFYSPIKEQIRWQVDTKTCTAQVVVALSLYAVKPDIK